MKEFALIENQKISFNSAVLFFIGIAGTGMSALAQFCAGIGKQVSGSDRYFGGTDANDIKTKLEAANINCFPQDGSGITTDTQLVIVSTAVEPTNIEYRKAVQLGIQIITRSELLTLISNTKKTVAIGGTSGKSTTTAMLFDILDYAGLHPSIISGAGLVRLQEQGKIGNAQVGNGDWLVIEADESDGSIVNYHPEIGLLLNIDKDHKEIEELRGIFQTFKNNSKQFVVNASHLLAAPFSQNNQNDFSTTIAIAGFQAIDFHQEGLSIQFNINAVPFTMRCMGRHNMENATAAVCIAHQIGVPLETCSEALKNYKGIYRRNQVLGKKNGIWIIDDYAHNPAKVAAAIRSMQPLATKVVAWFQPHGYGPTRFLRHDFVQEISEALRPQDEIWMSEIFYAGGTAIKDISANDLVQDLKAKGCNTYFVEDRNELVNNLKPLLTVGSVLLLMGARDPSLDAFARDVYDSL